MTYDDVLEITHNLYYNYQTALSITAPFILTPHWIFGKEVIKCLLELFELLPNHDVDYNRKKYRGLPVEVDHNNPTAIRLVLEVKRVVPKMMDGICYTKGEEDV